MKELQKLDVFLEKCEGIYIYGAGKAGRLLLHYLCQCRKIPVLGFIVSHRENAGGLCLGQKIYELPEVSIVERQGVIVAMQDIPFTVKQNCFLYVPDNIFFMYAELQSELHMWFFDFFCQYYNKQDSESRLSADVVKGDPACVYKMEQDRQIFRIYEIGSMSEHQVIRELCTREKFKECYGEIHFLERENSSVGYREKASIALCIITSHLDAVIPEREERHSYEMFLQAGAALTDIRKDCLKDHESENISEKNREYCECTGLYWIWKNMRDYDYVGLEHYRRRMKLDETLPSRLREHDIDIVLPVPQFCIDTNYEFMVKSLVTPQDWETVKRIILENDMTYKEIIEEYEKSHFYFSCNIGLLKREILDRYCAWAFAVSEALEKHYMEHNIIRKADRYMGFIFEHLFSVFIMKNYKKFKIVCTELLWCE